MLQDIWLTRHPSEYGRQYPAWYWLYFELSELRVSRDHSCRVLGVEPDFLRQCERGSAVIRPRAGGYNLLDLIAVDAIVQAREAKLPFDILIQRVVNWEELAWQAIVGAIRGKDIWMAVLPEKSAYYGAYFISEDHGHPTDAIPINLGSSVRRILVERNWPRLAIQVPSDGQWLISFAGGGRLLLETLPPEGNESTWSARVEDPDMKAYRPLSSENIREVDPIYSATPLWSDDPGVLKSRVDKAIDALLEVNLDPRVPADLRQMFEVVKGAVAYGFFYRPLTTFAASQIYAVEDAALYHRCVSAEIKPPRTFNKRIEVLLRAGIIPPYEADLWHAKRALRNSVAHRTNQWLLWPGMDFGAVESSALDINRLFTPIFADMSD